MSYLARIAVILLVSGFQLAAQNNQPNIVVILADDLGYGDLSCYGAADIKTPNLDFLAAEGARLTAFYANGPECTPTRAAFLTGRYQQRVGGMECAIGLGNIGRYEEAKKLSDNGELGLPVEFNVLPKILKNKGYSTGLIGKWHLGEGKAYRPGNHGFDYSIGPLGGAVDYFYHTEPIGEFIGTYMHGDHDFYRDGVSHKRDGYYMAHLLTDEAVEWIHNRKSEQPFFLYLSYTTPHTPLQTPDDLQDSPITMKDWRKGDRTDYTQMVEDLDLGIGRVLQKLKERGIEQNTIVIFFSDNGPTSIGSAGPFSGNKGHVFEGGIRVPCIIRWPGRITGGTISAQTFISMDITASIAAVTQSYPKQELDGIDLIGHLVSERSDFHRNLFWRKKRGVTVRSAVRSGPLKYIRTADGEESEEYLFDLRQDPGESKNLVDDHPDDLEQLKQLLSDWENEVKPERYVNGDSP